VDGHVCQLVFIDEGKEWDIDWALYSDFNSTHLSDRGRGLVIANHIVDRIERYRVTPENITYCTLLDTQV
jgi:anti-sigma regulatory factor (Ser/Thr protein kinase)